ncbi:MAG: cytochrome c [Pseudomonadota bacterium]
MNQRSISVIALTLFFCAAAHAQTVVGNASAGQYESAMCEGCHNVRGGFKTEFPEVYRAPMLNGQSAAYIAQCLADYRSGVRRNPTMKAVADILTPQQIANLSAYYAVAKNQKMK